jgi:hypothetical protein
MVKASSPSDYYRADVDAGKVVYSKGYGYYTSAIDVSNLLQIAPFLEGTTPNLIEVGKIIKRVEDRVDETIGHSFRPIIYKDEMHNFEFFRQAHYPVQPYKDYVGFIQLERPKILKLIRLEVWQGEQFVDLASATATYVPPISGSSYTMTLGVGGFSFVLTEGIDFFGSYGQKTTSQELVALINEVYPSRTTQFTGQSTFKQKTATNSASLVRNISDFFYASTDTDDATKVIISSLLPGEDGSTCTIAASAGVTTNFTDNQDQRRLGDYWTIDAEGKIFFLRNYPYVQSHSCKVTYVSGDSRVPGIIHDATTKLVAAEILVHDDNTILIAETGSNIDLKTKHDILIKEAEAILQSKKIVIYSL